MRNLGWVVAAVAVAVVLVLRPQRKPLSDPAEARALIEKQRVEFAGKLAARDKEVATIRTDGTLRILRLVGESYREHLATEKKPPAEADFAELMDVWTSSRDDKPFVIVWDADLLKLPGGGIGHVLAWEQAADAEGNRCVLLADGKTAKVMPDTEFQKLPKAK